MILSTAEREQKINDFLSRKLKEFRLDEEEPHRTRPVAANSRDF